MLQKAKRSRVVESSDDSEGEEGGFFFGSRAKTSEVYSILMLDWRGILYFSCCDESVLKVMN